MSKELVSINKMTSEQLALIKQTIAKGATDDELKLFVYRAESMSLDPLKPGTIHFVKYGSGPGTIVVGIEGFRQIAHRSGKLTGIKRGALKDDKGHLTGAWAEVYRSDWKECAREEVPLSEYDTKRGPWQKMPETMIKKVAECACLRMAFPNELGGVYEQAEMMQAEQSPVRPDAYGQPTEQDGVLNDGKYRIPFGKFKARFIEEIDMRELENYICYLESKAEKDGKEITGIVKEFIDRACEYLNAMNGEAQKEEQNDFENSDVKL